jgi:hypothetical protein
MVSTCRRDYEEKSSGYGGYFWRHLPCRRIRVASELALVKKRGHFWWAVFSREF